MKMFFMLLIGCYCTHKIIVLDYYHVEWLLIITTNRIVYCTHSAGNVTRIEGLKPHGWMQFCEYHIKGCVRLIWLQMPVFILLFCYVHLHMERS